MYLCQSELFEILLLTFKLFLCKTESLKIELLDHLTVWNQKTVLKQRTNCKQEIVYLS